MTPLERFLHARDFLLAHRTDYARAYAEFRWPQIAADEPFNWALDYFDALARHNQAIGLWLVPEGQPELRLTFAELADRSSRLARYLQRCGVRRGDRVLVMLPSQPELWESLLALMKLGAVIVPTTTLLTAPELLARIRRGGIRHLIAAAECTPACRELPPELTRFVVGGKGESPGWRELAAGYAEPAAFTPEAPTRAGDPLLLYFTSGTTAQPKLVLHTQVSYPIGHLSTMYWVGIQPGDVHYNISSPGWAKHAWSCVFAPWNAGATVLSQPSARFSAAATLGLLGRAAVTTLCAPPTVWRMLLLSALGPRPPALRECTSAGEPLNPEVIERVRAAWGITIRDGFGQTETTAVIGNSPGQPVIVGSMGRPLPGYQVQLLGADGRQLPAASPPESNAAPAAAAPAESTPQATAALAEGELVIGLSPRPVGLMVGYEDDPVRTAEAMAGGCYRTGDEAARDGAGYYHYVGRGDDVFKSSDYRISPFELESALLEHPAVAEAAVVPTPDPLRLFIAKAFVTLRPEVPPCRETAREVLLFARQRLAAYQRIRRLEFIELPKTISGKIRRVALRQREQERAAAGERPPGEFRLDELD
jgi:acetyl-CoA synthetase